MSRTLFNPGPTNTKQSVKAALLTEDMSHRCPEFEQVLAGIRHGLVTALGVRDSHSAVVLAASGTGACEAAIRQLDGDVLVVVNGTYSERLAQISEAVGLPTHRIRFEPFEPVDVARVEAALRAMPHAAALLFSHHETTTGVLAPSVPLVQMANRLDVLSVVDAISSIGAHTEDLAAAPPDYVVVTSNKGLEGLPGIAAVIARNDLLSRPGSCGSLYLDLPAHHAAQARGHVLFTMPIQVCFAAHAAIEQYLQETVGGRSKRYARMTDALRATLVAAGFELIELPPGQSSNVVVPVKTPTGFDYASTRDALACVDIEIYSPDEALSGGYLQFAAMGNLEHADFHRLGEALRWQLSMLDTDADGPNSDVQVSQARVGTGD